MPAVIVRRASFLPQIVEILGDCLADRRLIDALEGMAEDIEAVDHQVVGKMPAGRDLQRVVRRRLVGFVVGDLAQDARIVGTASVDAGLRCGGPGRIGGIVFIQHEREMMRQSANIGDGEAKVFGQLALNSRVELVNDRPLIVFRNGFDACRGQEAGARGAVGVREWVSVGERGWIPVDIGQRSDGVEGLPDGKGLRIGGLVPFVGADAAVEDARASADRRLAVSERIPRDTNSGGNVMQAVIGNAARHTGVSGEQHPQRRRGNLDGLRAGDKRRGQVRRLDRGQLHVIPQSEVERESREKAIVVLEKTRKIPSTQEPVVGSVLLHRAHLTGDKVGQCIPGARRSRGGEIEDPEVVQVADDHVLFQRQLAAEIE